MSKLPVPFLRSLLFYNTLLKFYLSDVFPNLLKQLEISHYLNSYSVLQQFSVVNVVLIFHSPVNSESLNNRSENILFTLVFIAYLAQSPEQVDIPPKKRQRGLARDSFLKLQVTVPFQQEYQESRKLETAMKVPASEPLSTIPVLQVSMALPVLPSTFSS